MSKKFDVWIRLPEKDRADIKKALTEIADRNSISVNSLVIFILRDWMTRKDRTIKLR